MRHQMHWELEPQTAGLGYASLLPDRFVGLSAGSDPGELTTYAFALPSLAVFVNARIATGGWVRAEILDAQKQPLRGFTEADCQPFSGDSVRHPVRWRGLGQSAAPVGQPARLRLRASQARVYAIFVVEPGETPVYTRFDAARP
ncbi:MAG: hypothetical protein FJ029_05960 [Actinobacteria bacterium]|nr:hypothetical protein [Actinomycetota bacterium]